MLTFSNDLSQNRRKDLALVFLVKSRNLNRAVHADAGIPDFDDLGIPVVKARYETGVRGYGVKGEEVKTRD